MAEDDKPKPLSGKTEDQESKPVPRNVWIPALAFTTACLILLFIAFFIGNLQPDQRRILNAIFSLLTGFATFFIGGTALIRLTGSLHGLKVVFTGTAGVAMFDFYQWEHRPTPTNLSRTGGEDGQRNSETYVP
jgi:hypothetical protein